MFPHLLDVLAASGAVGSLLPALIALINQEHWHSHTKGLVTAVASTLGGLVTAWQWGDFRGASPVVAVVVVFLVTSVSFRSFWLPTQWAPLIEAFTTFSRGKLPDRPIPTPLVPPSQ